MASLLHIANLLAVALEKEGSIPSKHTAVRAAGFVMPPKAWQVVSMQQLVLLLVLDSLNCRRL